MIESISVDVHCDGRNEGWTCEEHALAAIVSTGETDLVLMPVGWQAATEAGGLATFCPHHKKEKR